MAVAGGERMHKSSRRTVTDQNSGNLHIWPILFKLCPKKQTLIISALQCAVALINDEKASCNTMQCFYQLQGNFCLETIFTTKPANKVSVCSNHTPCSEGNSSSSAGWNNSPFGRNNSPFGSRQSARLSVRSNGSPLPVPKMQNVEKNRHEAIITTRLFQGL